MKLRALVMMTMVTFAAPVALAIEEGEQAPAFTLPAMQEGEPDISLAALRGKTVYVDFWASWCAPCLRSMPLINELYGKYQDRGFEVVAINVDDPIEDGEDFLIDRDFDFLIA
ncbi:MAG: TlpA family protein disulfide reductase, partial [Pseudomonas sp.]